MSNCWHVDCTQLYGREFNTNKLCGRPPQYAIASCKLTFDLLTLKVVSESRDVGYLCANFSLPRPLCSRLRPNVCDRQTSDRRASSFNASALWGVGHNNPVLPQKCHPGQQLVFVDFGYRILDLC